MESYYADDISEQLLYLLSSVRHSRCRILEAHTIARLISIKVYADFSSLFVLILSSIFIMTQMSLGSNSYHLCMNLCN